VDHGHFHASQGQSDRWVFSSAARRRGCLKRWYFQLIPNGVEISTPLWETRVQAINTPGFVDGELKLNFVLADQSINHSGKNK
jgi:hypothetical protein